MGWSQFIYEIICREIENTYVDPFHSIRKKHSLPLNKCAVSYTIYIFTFIVFFIK